MSYVSRCVLFFLGEFSENAQIFYEYINSIYSTHLDNRRDYIYINSNTNINGNAYILIACAMTYSSEAFRDQVWDIMNNNKQYCWQEGEFIENQFIEKYNTGSPTYGSPIYNINRDQWGMDC